MMIQKPSPQEAQAAVVRAKEQLRNSSVLPEHLDAVASMMAFFELSKSNGQTASVIGNMLFPVTFVEWAQHFNLKTHIDRFLAAAVYLMEHEQVKAVNTSTIARMYDKARWKKPANLADVFAKAAEKVYLTEAPSELIEEDGLKMWQITRTGYEYFQSLNLED